jgi:hypothetical protein
MIATSHEIMEKKMNDADLIDRLAEAVANRIKPTFPLDIELLER